MPDAIQSVRARIDEYRAWSGGPPPPRVAVSPEEYRELVAALVPVEYDTPLDLCVLGVPIHVDRRSYPWGSFPAPAPDDDPAGYVNPSTFYPPECPTT